MAGDQFGQFRLDLLADFSVFGYFLGGETAVASDALHARQLLRNGADDDRHDDQDREGKVQPA